MKRLPREVERPPMSVAIAEGAKRVAITGRAVEPEVGTWLCPLIDDIHHAAVAAEHDEVVLDLRHLEHANAALWRCLVYWLRVLRRDEAARYQLRVFAAPTHRWQIIGMSTLKVIGADRLRVEEV